MLTNHITVTPRNKSPEEIREARALEYVANRNVKHTSIPLLHAEHNLFCARCIMRDVDCKRCRVGAFAAVLAEAMTKEMVEKIRAQLTEEDIKMVLGQMKSH